MTICTCVLLSSSVIPHTDPCTLGSGKKTLASTPPVEIADSSDQFLRPQQMEHLRARMSLIISSLFVQAVLGIVYGLSNLTNSMGQCSS
jgi:hypothetical protein